MLGDAGFRLPGVLPTVLKYFLYFWVVIIAGSTAGRFIRWRLAISSAEKKDGRRIILPPPPLVKSLTEYISSLWPLDRITRRVASAVGGRLTRGTSGEDLEHEADEKKKTSWQVWYDRLEKTIAEPRSSAFGAVYSNAVLLSLALLETVLNAGFKVLLLSKSLAYMFLSKETQGWKDAVERKRAIYPLVQPPSGVIIARRTVILIRHGESMWNYLFNRDLDFKFILRAIVMVVREAFLFCEYDSVIIDSPLSAVGVTQAAQLRSWLLANSPATKTGDESKKLNEGNQAFVAEFAATLKGTKNSTRVTLVASNLRRAISTMAVALQDRLSQRPDEKVYIHSDMQEITFNPDARTLALAKGHAQPSAFEKEVLTINMERFYNDRLNTSTMHGNKRMSQRAATRLDAFCSWLFHPASPCGETGVDHLVVAAGHSMWIKMFCNYYMPPGIDLPIQTRKISNCACLKVEVCNIRASDGTLHQYIDPTSPELLWGQLL